GVGLGEVQDQLALLVDGDAGHDDVALAALGGSQGAVEVHVVDLELQPQLLGDGGGDLSVDAHDVAAVVGHLIGREGSVGGHGEHTLGDGGELGGGGGVLSGGALFRGGLGGVAAAGQGQHAKEHGPCHEDGEKLLHDGCNLFSFYFFALRFRAFLHYTQYSKRMQDLFRKKLGKPQKSQAVSRKKPRFRRHPPLFYSFPMDIAYQTQARRRGLFPKKSSPAEAGERWGLAWEGENYWKLAFLFSRKAARPRSEEHRV